MSDGAVRSQLGSEGETSTAPSAVVPAAAWPWRGLVGALAAVLVLRNGIMGLTLARLGAGTSLPPAPDDTLGPSPAAADGPERRREEARLDG